MSAPRPTNPVQMAVIGAPHGIKGEVRVKTFTGDPESIGDYGPLFGPDGRVFEIARARLATNGVVLRFAGIADRDSAAALTGTPLFIDRSALPDDLDEEEFYHADLIGLEVKGAGGMALGHIVAVHDFGGGDVLELKLADGRSIMIPFTKAAVPEVDTGSGFARIDPVAAGIEADDEAQPAARSGKEGASFDAASRPRGPHSAGGNR
ncbi:MAG: ribosome maturation factor RimM [Rhizobiaceae bacterium]|nr:MAG: ribosome maturation factor RimM [Rhizobiaceae bacterium]